MDGPCFDLATTLSKLLHLGMTLDEVVEASHMVAVRVRDGDDVRLLDVSLALGELRVVEHRHEFGVRPQADAVARGEKVTQWRSFDVRA